MEKKFFVDENGNESWVMECGCEGIKISGYGWKTILCDMHQDEEDALLEEDPYPIRKIRKSDREN